MFRARLHSWSVAGRTTRPHGDDIGNDRAMRHCTAAPAALPPGRAVWRNTRRARRPQRASAAAPPRNPRRVAGTLPPPTAFSVTSGHSGKVELQRAVKPASGVAVLGQGWTVDLQRESCYVCEIALSSHSSLGNIAQVSPLVGVSKFAAASRPLAISGREKEVRRDKVGRSGGNSWGDRWSVGNRGGK